MKFNLTGGQWLDPSTFRVAFQLNNHNGSNSTGFAIMVQPLSWNPAVFFRRARLICGGQVIEDIDDFNRLSLMLTDLLPEDDQHDIACEGFVNFDFVKGEAAQAPDERKGYRQDDYDRSGNVTVARRVQFKPMLGLFSQEKLIPLRYCPIQIELELVNQQAEAVITEAVEGFQNGVSWVQIGAKSVPEYPVNSLAESYSQLKKTVGRSFKMHSSWHRSCKYIIGLDLEKISGAGFTGMSTKAGDLFTINFRDCDALGGADSVPSRVFCALNYDCVLNIQDSGIQLLD